MNSTGVLDFAAKNKTQILDLRFVDLPGIWQHVSFPIQELSENSFKEGFGFDASSIRGWASIHESDMLLMPDPSTAFMDPFREAPTLVMIGDAVDPLTRKPYGRDPRGVAKRAEAYLEKSGIADTAYFGAEAEFFIFDNVYFDTAPQHGFYFIDAEEGRWNSARPDNNLGFRPRVKEGYFPVPPTDHYQDLRTEMVQRMIAAGIDIECHHHEVGGPGQAEIDMRYNTLLKSADGMMMYKYIVRNTAYRAGKSVTFMPKPLFGGDKYAGLSEIALHYAGGLLKHAPALAAFVAPTTNSYKRLVPGYEAPVNLAYSQRNRSAAVRIPVYSPSPKAKRLEFRPPDPSCNPYLAFAAMLMAGLDGIKHKIDPGKPLDKDIFELEADEAAKIPSMPGSLEEALSELENDHKFLLEGDVFTKEFIELWINYKKKTESDPVRMRPHPYEFHLYYD